MQKLLKSYQLTDVSEYYDIIVMSVINGQNKQSISQFKAMPKANQKDFIINGNLTERQQQAFIMIL